MWIGSLINVKLSSNYKKTVVNQKDEINFFIIYSEATNMSKK